MGGVISYVELGSIAEDLEWQPGDELVSINGHLLRDIIDYRFFCSDEFITVLLRRGEQEAEFEIEKDVEEPLGVQFEDVLFDGIHTCGAHCVFCFVEQLPKGLRKTLYLKDDDYRLSFLDGNFVTLGNVSQEDLQRIVEQRLSPLYVSVHTTNPKLREQMIGREAPQILDQIDFLAQGRITLQTQIVLCRGINDGVYLERSIEDLAARYPTVQSIAIVPAGISIHRRNETPIGAIDPEYSRGLVNTVRRWQKKFKAEKGTRLVWAADEFYLNAGEPLPGAAVYEGFPQIQNGIGLVRTFKDSAARAKRIVPCRLQEPTTVSIVTGMLAEPIIKEWAGSLRCENLRVNVYSIENTLFGPTVTVTGLISGKDVIKQLRGKDIGQHLIIPSVSLRDNVFLDDVSLEDVERELGVPVVVTDPLPYPLMKRILEILD